VVNRDIEGVVEYQIQDPGHGAPLLSGSVPEGLPKVVIESQFEVTNGQVTASLMGV
jgi:hypothetical protein